MTPQVHLVSFADSRLVKARKRFLRQASRFGRFLSVTVFSEVSLEPEFQSRHAEILNSDTRGFGYWIWKPRIILDLLSNLPDGSIVIYADVGFHVNRNGRATFDSWITQFSQSPEFLLLFQADPPEGLSSPERASLPFLTDAMYSKRDLLEFLGMENEESVREATIGAGLIGLKNSGEARNFVATWLKIMEDHPRLIDDSASHAPEDEDFREHRHDQAVFSLLAKKNGLGLRMSTFEYWYPKTSGAGANWGILRSKPFLAKRDHVLKVKRGRLRKYLGLR